MTRTIVAFLLLFSAQLASASSDITGTVKGPKGPEAGVWVIAETTDLATRFARIVVTDEEGRFLVPDLPKANYSVWVRGYGLVDSPKMRAIPGQMLDLSAVAAPDARSAAQYYPAIYWYSMMKIPEASQFGGSTSIPKQITQPEWLTVVKNRSCVGCHQLGQVSTRTIPAQLAHITPSDQAWIRRVQSGQAANNMILPLAGHLGGAPFKYFGDWTDRIAKGELPHAKPQRPQGVERKIVVTWWEWGEAKRYLHDLIASDRRFPSVNASGPLFGSPEYSTDNMPILDPKTHKVSFFRMPVRDADTPEALGPGHAAMEKPMAPSPYWGDEKIWDSRANNHNGMFGRDGRVWFAAAVRGPNNPDYCKKGSEHPSAKVFPLERTNRHVSVLEPKTMKYGFVDTCFGSHHLQFDAKDRLWTSGAPVAGWVDTKLFDETGDAARSQGWSPFVLDTNGNGRRDEWTEPTQPADAQKDLRVAANTYSVMPNPADGSIWYTVFAPPGGILRFDPQTQLSELYRVPMPGFGPRGGDIDKKGVVWVSLGSGHLGSFDRAKCKGPLNGPKATGEHCPEGWAFHRYPGPGFKGIGANSAESSYYTWVDQHNTFGLGEDVPMSTGNLNDGLIALKDAKMIVLRVPYPLGFYAKGFDGRIDDPAAGWKGRGLWTASGDRAPWLREGGKGSLPLAVQFQLRPSPLAR